MFISAGPFLISEFPFLGSCLFLISEFSFFPCIHEGTSLLSVHLTSYCIIYLFLISEFSFLISESRFLESFDLDFGVLFFHVFMTVSVKKTRRKDDKYM